jgi:hypothetical protein
LVGPTEAAESAAAEILTAAREELTRADMKASLLLAAGGIAVSPFLTAILSNAWRPSRLSSINESFWWLGVAAVCIGLASLGVAVYPRVRAKGFDRDTVSYYGDVVAAPVSELQARLERAVSVDKAIVYDQLWQISRIVTHKYLAIRLALLAFGAAGIAMGIALFG